MLRKANLTDASRIAAIHSRELSTDFLSSLKEKFLISLYVSFINDGKINVLVYESEKKVVGFVVGSSNFSRDFRKILVKNFFNFFLILIPEVIMHPQIIKNIFETFFYTSKQKENSSEAELVAVAISSEFHRHGIGKNLVNSLEIEFKKEAVKEYKVSVNKTNATANKFYAKLGFIKTGDFNLYGKKVNLYLKQLK
jgi:ribosomal protein S18 acetylase RimI-like enzyme